MLILEVVVNVDVCLGLGWRCALRGECGGDAESGGGGWKYHELEHDRLRNSG